LPPLLNSKIIGTSWAELAQKGSDVKVSTQQNKRGYFLMHLEKCEGSQDSFQSSILSSSMRGRRSVVEDYGKQSSDESEISIHSSPTSGYVYFLKSGKASFACTGRTSILLDTVNCSVHFTDECFTQAFYEKGTRKYLKPGSVPAIRKKNISNHI